MSVENLQLAHHQKIGLHGCQQGASNTSNVWKVSLVRSCFNIYWWLARKFILEPSGLANPKCTIPTLK